MKLIKIPNIPDFPYHPLVLASGNMEVAVRRLTTGFRLTLRAATSRPGRVITPRLTRTCTIIPAKYEGNHNVLCMLC